MNEMLVDDHPHIPSHPTRAVDLPAFLGSVFRAPCPPPPPVAASPIPAGHGAGRDGEEEAETMFRDNKPSIILLRPPHTRYECTQTWMASLALVVLVPMDLCMILQNSFSTSLSVRSSMSLSLR